MAEVLIDLLPVMVGAAAAPIYPIIVLLLLQGRGGLGKATALIGGVVSVRLVQGLLFLVILGAAVSAGSAEGGRPIASTLLLVLGILLLVAALKKWRKEEDPDDPPPKWMTGIAGLTVPRAFGAGALLVTIAVKQWVFTLSAIGIIAEAQLSSSAAITAYLLFILATQVLVLPALVFYAVAPGRAAGPLQSARTWLERNNRTIVIIVSVVFGLWFSYKGVMGLLGL